MKQPENLYVKADGHTFQRNVKTVAVDLATFLLAYFMSLISLDLSYCISINHSMSDYCIPHGLGITLPLGFLCLFISVNEL